MIRCTLNYLAAILFFCSLPLQVFTIGDADVNGFGALIYGWVGVGRSFGWSWLANPLFILTLFLFFHRKRRFRRTAVCTAATALLLSLSFLLVDKIPGDKTQTMVGMVMRKFGYWIWLYSMAALMVAAILNNNEGAGKLQSTG
jgi:hypothetical protein